MRERRYGAKGERACKPNCKFSVSWIISILVSILISIWNFSEKVGGETRGGVGRLISFRTSRLISIWDFFPKGRRTCGRGHRGRGRRRTTVFRGLSPRSLTRKPTYNKTCNPTYNPSYCPHTSDVARGGTAIGAFGTAELWSRKHGGEGKGAQRDESK